jgi:uncharacterized membrane protein
LFTEAIHFCSSNKKGKPLSFSKVVEVDHVQTIAEYCAGGLELLGLGIISTVLLYASLRALFQLLKSKSAEDIYRDYRHQMARGILLGLEPLVGADIIHTIAIELTFTSVGVLAVVVLIRTFLSFSLEVELTGKWPWQNREPEKAES